MIHSMKQTGSNTPKILILGTLPSEESIKKQEYYSNTKNQFWFIISNVFENQTIEFNNYNEKVSFLKKHHIVLWDVLKSAEREGSLDKNIKNVIYNDLDTYIKEHKIHKILLNGGKATKLFKKYIKSNRLNLKYISLTSTSNANTRYTVKTKINIWKKEIIDNNKI